MGSVFRYGRPQKGRYRQFFQLNAELIGSQAAGADVEIIALFCDLFRAWGFENLTVLVNSVGQPGSRQAYGEKLRATLAPYEARLSEDSKKRLEQNPMRVLDSKSEADLAVLAKIGARLPHLLDVLDDADRAHWDAVLAGLEKLGIRHELDHGLVRGLDYYTRTAFEVHDRSLGAQSALGGGGRYDGLIEQLGGPATPGVGFAIGLDRTLHAIEERGVAPSAASCVYVISMEATRDAALALVRELRGRFAVESDVEERAFSAQMKAAGKSGAALAVILGEDEWKRGEVTLKDLASGEQSLVKKDDLSAAIASRLNAKTESGIR
jgi:histidyl-tRNA synthetase